MRIRWSYALALVLLPIAAGATPANRGLDFYFVDVEGGAATLVVTPSGESVLIDCGAPGDRDASRIAHAAQVAGLKRIDHLIATHWHSDHFGGTPDLVKRIPVAHFYNRGIPAGKGDEGALYDKMMAAYKQCSTGKATTLKPGDSLPLRSSSASPSVKILTLCGSKHFLPEKPGAPKNKYAEEFLPQAPDPSDNAQSLGFLLTFGKFRFVDLGDLTWNMEEKLVDPTDKIGQVDVFQTTHHGLEISNNPVLIKTLNPRVAVFNNGPRKGGHPDVTMTLRQLPEIKAIYQLHKNLTSMESDNTTPDRIANTADTPQCKGEFIHLSVAPDGKSYTVQVGERGKRERFATRR